MNVYGQRKNLFVEQIPVHCNVKEHVSNSPLYFLNGNRIHQRLLSRIDTKVITGVQIEKGEYKLNGMIYPGKVFIVTKDTYKPDFMTLSEVRSTYNHLRNRASLIQIDGKIINVDLNMFCVDKIEIKEVIVDELDYKERDLQIDIITLIIDSGEPREHEGALFDDIR